MNDFIKWLEDLETQTLTDELKQSILSYVEEVLHDEYLRGYKKAAHDALEVVTNLYK